MTEAKQSKRPAMIAAARLAQDPLQVLEDGAALGLEDAGAAVGETTLCVGVKIDTKDLFRGIERAMRGGNSVLHLVPKNESIAAIALPVFLLHFKRTQPENVSPEMRQGYALVRASSAYYARQRLMWQLAEWGYALDGDEGGMVGVGAVAQLDTEPQARTEVLLGTLEGSLLDVSYDWASPLVPMGKTPEQRLASAFKSVFEDSTGHWMVISYDRPVSRQNPRFIAAYDGMQQARRVARMRAAADANLIFEVVNRKTGHTAVLAQGSLSICGNAPLEEFEQTIDVFKRCTRIGVNIPRAPHQVWTNASVPGFETGLEESPAMDDAQSLDD